MALCAETVSAGHSVLVFAESQEYSKNTADVIGARLCKSIDGVAAFPACAERLRVSRIVCQLPFLLLKEILAVQSVQTQLQPLVKQLGLSASGTDERLAHLMQNGVAYHHAGMSAWRFVSMRVLCE